MSSSVVVVVVVVVEGKMMQLEANEHRQHTKIPFVQNTSSSHGGKGRRTWNHSIH
jgi:hypothetical protein